MLLHLILLIISYLKFEKEKYRNNLRKIRKSIILHLLI